MREIKTAKNKFVAESAMTFAQYIGTAGLATGLFKEYAIAWKIALGMVMILLIIMAVTTFPNKNGDK